MNNSAAARSARSLFAVVAIAASALGAACSNPVGPGEMAAAPRTSVQAAPETQANSAAAKSDSTAVRPQPEGKVNSGGGTIPWY